jgi:hypothetical protein
VGEGKSLTNWLEKAGAVAHVQQPGAGKLVKAAVGGKFPRGEKTHFPLEL